MVKSVLQILLGFGNAPILLLQYAHSVAMPVLNGRFMEEAGVMFPFLEPLDMGFLAPIDFLLSLSLIKFLQEGLFLKPQILTVTIENDLGLEMLYIGLENLLFLKNIAEGVLVPFFDAVFEVFQLLLELIHAGAPKKG